MIGVVKYAVYSNNASRWFIAMDLKTLAWALLRNGEAGNFPVIIAATICNEKHKQGTFNYSWGEAYRHDVIEKYPTNFAIKIEDNYCWVGDKRYRLYRPVRRACDFLPG